MHINYSIKKVSLRIFEGIGDVYGEVSTFTRTCCRMRAVETLNSNKLNRYYEKSSENKSGKAVHLVRKFGWLAIYICGRSRGFKVGRDYNNYCAACHIHAYSSTTVHVRHEYSSGNVHARVIVVGILCSVRHEAQLATPAWISLMRNNLSARKLKLVRKGERAIYVSLGAACEEDDIMRSGTRL